MRARHWALLGGALVGVVVAREVSRRRERSHEVDLFHGRPPVRHMALSWLDRHPSLSGLARLREYVGWEPIPALQRRGTAILERMTLTLGQGDAA
jgi:hypothetical protein